MALEPSLKMAKTRHAAGTAIADGITQGISGVASSLNSSSPMSKRLLLWSFLALNVAGWICIGLLIAH